MEKLKQAIKRMESVEKKKMKKTNKGWVVASLLILGMSSIGSPILTLATVSESVATNTETTENAEIEKEKHLNEIKDQAIQKINSQLVSTTQQINELSHTSDEQKNEAILSLNEHIKETTKSISEKTMESEIATAVENETKYLTEEFNRYSNLDIENAAKETTDNQVNEGEVTEETNKQVNEYETTEDTSNQVNKSEETEDTSNQVDESEEIKSIDSADVKEAEEKSNVKKEKRTVTSNNQSKALDEAENDWVFTGTDNYRRTKLVNEAPTTSLSILSVDGYEIGTNLISFNLESTFPEDFTPNKMYGISVILQDINNPSNRTQEWFYNYEDQYNILMTGPMRYSIPITPNSNIGQLLSDVESYNPDMKASFILEYRSSDDISASSKARRIVSQEISPSIDDPYLPLKKSEIVDKINASTALTDTEKAQYIKEVEDQKLNNRNEADELVSKYDLIIVKSEGKKELNDNAEAKKTEIDKLTGVSEEAKTAAKNSIDQLTATGQQQIDGLTSSEAIANQVQTSSEAMDVIYNNLASESNGNLASAREKAKAELQAKADSAKAEIDTMNHLTDEEIQASKVVIDSLVEEGNKNIDEAMTLENITAAQKTSEAKIDEKVNESLLLNEKNKEKKELQEKADSTKKGIDELVGVSSAEKTAAKTNIDELLTVGLSGIDSAQTSADIEKQVTTSSEAMDDVYNNLASKNEENIKIAKEKAKADLLTESEKAKNQIDNLTDLSEKDKQERKDAIDSIAKEGEKAIDDAKTVEEFTTAQRTHVEKIETVVTESQLLNEKNKEKKELQDKATSTKNGIDGLLGVTTAEKTAAKVSIDELLTVGEQKIDEATTSEAIANQVVTSKTAMDAIYNNLATESKTNIDLAKEKAKADLSTEAKRAKEDIDNMTHLSADEKQEHKTAIDSIVENGEKAINDATTFEEFTNAQNLSKEDLDRVVAEGQLLNEKNKAKEELEAKAESTKKGIDALLGVEEVEKTAAKTSINDLLTEGLANIDKATTSEAIDTQVTTSEAAMDAIYNDLASASQSNLNLAKDKAKAELSIEADRAKEEIRTLDYLTEDEKKAYQKEIDTLVEEGKEAIDKETTVKDITNSQKEYVEKIDKQEADSQFHNEKNKAKKELEARAESTKAGIDKLTGVAADEKSKAKGSIDDLLTAGISGIDEAATSEAIATQVTASKAAMDAVYNSLVAESETNVELAKDKAEVELSTEANNAKNEIDAMPHLTDDEKKEHKDAIDAIVEEGKKAIQEAESPEEISTNQQSSKDEIEKTVADSQLLNEKNKAQKELQDKTESTKAGIDALLGVSEKEKSDAQKNIDELLKEGISEIEKAESIEAITTQVSDTKSAMDVIYNDLASESQANLELAREKAKAELLTEANRGKAEIEAMPHLTDDEKKDYQEAIDALVKEGNEAIDKATTLEEITESETASENKIDNKVVESQLQNDKNKEKKELQEKADSTKAAIDELVGLTLAERNTAKHNIDGWLQNGISTIDSAQTSTDVAKKAADAKAEMDDVYDHYALTSEENIKLAKARAKADLLTESDKAKSEIEAMSYLSEDEKQKYKADIDSIVTAGNKAIDDAMTVKEFTTAKKTNEEVMDKKVLEAQLHNEQNKAKKELQDKADSTKKGIDGLLGVDDAEKEAAKTNINKLLEEGNTKIDEAKTSAAITNQVSDTKEAMDDVYNELASASQINLDLAKEKAKAELSTEADRAKAEIEAMPHLTADERKDYQEAIDALVKEGNEAIGKATTFGDISTAQQTSDAKIDKKEAESQLRNEKNKEKKELEAKAEFTKTSIDKLMGVTAEEKDSAKESIDELLEKGLSGIEKAETSEAIATQVATSEKAMDDIYNNLVSKSETNIELAKAKAKSELASEATEAKKEIENMAHLTDEEKTAYQAAIDTIAVDANKKIDEALSPSDITTIQTAAEAKIDKKVVESQLLNKQNKAKKELKEKAESTKQGIDKLTGVTKAEKDAAKVSIDELLVKGEAAIDKASTSEEIEAQVTASKDAMDAVYNKLASESNDNLDLAKEKAKAELLADSERAIKEVDAMAHLTDDQKQEQKKAIEDIIKEGTEAIDKGKNFGDITTAQTSSEAKIDKKVAESELLNEKNKEKKELTEDAEAVKKAIDKLTGVSEDEKTVAKASVDELLKEGLLGIDEAKASEEIATQVSTSNKAMDDVYNKLASESETNINLAKKKAKAELLTEAERAEKEINNMAHLTADEKKTYQEAIDVLVKEGNEAIDSGITYEDITTAQTTSEAKIDKKVVEGQVHNEKNGAKQELQDKAESTKNGIDQLLGVEETEKGAAKQTIDQLLETGLLEINKATTTQAVSSQVITSKEAMDDIYNNLASTSETNLGLAKDKAQAELSVEAERAKKEIDTMTHLTDEEKEAQKAAIDTIVEEGNETIAKAETFKEITTSQTASEAKIDGKVTASELLNEKNKTKKELEVKAESTKKGIDKLTGVSDKDKSEAKANIDQLLETGLLGIDEAKTIDEITSQEITSREAMDDVYNKLASASNTNLSLAKDKAKAELSLEGERAKKEIDTMAYLTADEKKASKAAVDTLVKEGNEEIDKATTFEKITSIKIASETKIDDKVAESQFLNEKNKAKKEIEKKAESTKTGIDKLAGVSKEEKTEAKATIDQLLEDGLLGIEEAKTSDAISKQVQISKKAMDEIYGQLNSTSNDNLDSAQEKAKDELVTKVEDAKKEIDDMTHLTDEEKEAFKEAIDELATDGNQLIDKGATFEDITDNQTTTEKEIAEKVAESQLRNEKNKAKKDLEEKAESTKTAIDKLAEVSKEAKEEAKKDIDQLLEEGLSEVEKAEKSEAIAAQVTSSKKAMDDIYNQLASENNSTLEVAQEKAESELSTKAEEAKKEIDDMTHLTDKEKQDFKDAIDAIIKDGKEAIDEAATVEEITKGQASTEEKIAETIAESQLLNEKNKAKKELQAKAESTKKEVDKLTGVSEKEKTKAKKEIDQLLKAGLLEIDNAKTKEAVNNQVQSSKKAMDDIYNKLASTNDKNLELANEKAKTELSAKAEEAKKEIDNMTYLTEKEKKAYKDAIDALIKEGNEAIDKGASVEEITAAQIRSEEKIAEKIAEGQLLNEKNKAKKELQAKAELTKQAIDKLTGVSSKEKEAAKKEIDQLLSAGLLGIDKATNNEAIAKQVQTSKKAMDDIFNKIVSESEKNLALAKKKDKTESTTKKEVAKTTSKTNTNKNNLPKTNDTLANKNVSIIGALMIALVGFALPKRKKSE